MQYQDGDQYGLLTSNDLRDLLTYFARPDNQSFCLITSRAPLLDLMDYTTYTIAMWIGSPRGLDAPCLDGWAFTPLPAGEGDGVRSTGQRSFLIADGHALTISLLGSYLAENTAATSLILPIFPSDRLMSPRV